MISRFNALIFLTSFLLFVTQPLVGKEILPFVGGSIHGWLVTLAFFQTTLVGGYALVYFLQKATALQAGLTFIGCLVLGISTFLYAPANPTADIQAPGALFLWLWQTRGVCLIALSASAPMIQRLFFHAHHDKNPYTLYAISNVGSFAGLLAYPFLLEPLMGLEMQKNIWVTGYMLAIALVCFCIKNTRKVTHEAHTHDNTAISLKMVGLWLVLAALPASMLSGSTAFINTNIASFPLLWVIPLCLYLLSYILAFSDKRPQNISSILFTFLGLSILFLAFDAAHFPVISSFHMILILCVFTLCAYLSHLALYMRRPAPGQLPLFYLILAIGGAIGGCINAFLVPLVLNSAYEFSIACALCVLFLPILYPYRTLERRYGVMLLAGFALTLILMVFVPPHIAVALSVILFLIFLFCILYPSVAAAGFFMFLMASPFLSPPNQSLVFKHRNYFGVLSVLDSNENTYRIFNHGNTTHGTMPFAPEYNALPVSYYGVSGPAGQALTNAPSGSVAVIGLGTGQMGCYQSANRTIDFYEIDPDVITIAKNNFNYLTLCPPRDIILGDARLSLQNQTGKNYKVIVLDAFSSDAIPTHLLTQQAIATYKKHLATDGVLLFHISNRHLDLSGILARQAENAGMQALIQSHNPDRRDPYDSKSIWVVLSSNDAYLTKLKTIGWQNIPTTGPLWSDDRFSLLRILKF